LFRLGDRLKSVGDTRMDESAAETMLEETDKE